MNLVSLFFGLAGIGLVTYGAYVLYRVPKQLKEGKTRLTGKLIAMGTPDVEKEKSRATFWYIILWNIVRSLLAMGLGIFLAISGFSSL